MTEEIQRLETPGKIMENIFKSLGSIKNKTLKKSMENLASEQEINLERNKEVFNKGFDYFFQKDCDVISYSEELKEFQLDGDIVDELERRLVECYGGYLEIIRTYTVKNIRTNIDPIINKNLVEPLIRATIKSVDEKFISDKFITDFTKNNFTKQIKDSLLHILKKENFGFLNISEDKRKDSRLNLEKYGAYEFLRKFETSNTRSKSINDFVNFIGNKLTNEGIKLSIKEQKSLLMSLFLARFYQNISKKFNFSFNILDKIRQIKNFNKLTFEELVPVTLKELKELPFHNHSTEEWDDIFKFSMEVKKNSKDKSKQMVLEKTCNELLKKSQGFEYVVLTHYATYLKSIGENLKALEIYKNAMNESLYKNTDFFRMILKNGLNLSAYLGKLKEFKVFYKQAYSNGLILEPWEEVDKWIYASISEYTSNVLCGDLEDTLDINLDEASLIRALKNNEYEKALNFLGNPKIIDLNKTSLMEAIENDEYEKAIELFNFPKTIEEINTISLRKKSTHITLLLESLKIHKYKNFKEIKKILLLLLKNNANINQISSAFDFSPLYLLLIFIKNDSLRQTAQAVTFKSRLLKKNDVEFIFSEFLSSRVSDFYLVDPLLLTDDGNSVEIKNRKLELLDIFLENDADINQEMPLGFSSLFLACSLRDLDIFKKILKYNPNFSQRSKSGLNLLQFAISLKCDSIVEYLIHERINIKKESEVVQTVSSILMAAINKVKKEVPQFNDELLSLAFNHKENPRKNEIIFEKYYGIDYKLIENIIKHYGRKIDKDKFALIFCQDHFLMLDSKLLKILGMK